MSGDVNKKERVIHTRIPASLEEQIKRLADSLRVPVSNLVRNMLEDAIDMTRRVRDRVPAAMGVAGAAASAPDDLSDVYGWQSLTLNLDTACARCERGLVAGDDAYVGLTDRPREARVFICSACLPRPGRNGTSTNRDKDKDKE